MALYAVVGATGQIGGEVVRLLDDAGEDVRALVRDRSRARETLRTSVELIDGDMADAARLRRLLCDVAGLFVVSSDPAAEPAVYEAAGAQRVPLVVKSSAIGFGTEPPAAHAKAEAVLKRQPAIGPYCARTRSCRRCAAICRRWSSPMARSRYPPAPAPAPGSTPATSPPSP